MTIYNMANILTGFIESIMMYMLYNAFCEKKIIFLLGYIIPEFWF